MIKFRQNNRDKFYSISYDVVSGFLDELKNEVQRRKIL